MRKYSLAWIWIGLLAVTGLVAYGASSSLDFVISEKLIINGKEVRLPVINYNGNVYVPLRLVGGEMYSAVHYDDNKELIIIDQKSVKFDEQISAPVPYVAYERKYKDGDVWLQEIPLLLGNSCWKGCIEVPGPVAQWVKKAEYPPVSVKPGSNLAIKYPDGLKPGELKVFNVIPSGGATERFAEMFIEDDRLQLPVQPGVYNIIISSRWLAGYTSYAFVVHIADGNDRSD